MCIVAPYEADAQLAYLEMQGITQFTITEDSDLLIYGCRKVFHSFLYIKFVLIWIAAIKKLDLDFKKD